MEAEGSREGGAECPPLALRVVRELGNIARDERQSEYTVTDRAGQGAERTRLQLEGCAFVTHSVLTSDTEVRQELSLGSKSDC